MRKPRILTWWSSRPRYSISPSGQPARQVAGPIQPRARLRRTDRARSARPSGPAGPDSRAPPARRRCESSPGTPTGTGSPVRSEHVDGRCWPPAGRSARLALLARPGRRGRSRRPRPRSDRTGCAARRRAAPSARRSAARARAAAPRRCAITRRRLAQRSQPRLLQERLEHRRHEVNRRDPSRSRWGRPGRPGRDARPAGPGPAARRSISGQKNSQTETSKLNGVFCSTRSLRAPGRRPACIQSRRLTMPRWVLIAPFGRPVEPEV